MIGNRPHPAHRWEEFRFEDRRYMLEHRPPVLVYLHDDGDPPEAWVPSWQPGRPFLWQWVNGGWAEVTDYTAARTIWAHHASMAEAAAPDTLVAEAEAEVILGTKPSGRPRLRAAELHAALIRGVAEGWVSHDKRAPVRFTVRRKREAFATEVWPSQRDPVSILKGARYRADFTVEFQADGTGAEGSE